MCDPARRPTVHTLHVFAGGNLKPEYINMDNEKDQVNDCKYSVVETR